MTLSLKVYAADSTTLVDDIDDNQWRYAEFNEVNSKTGFWKIILPNLVANGATNPALALLTTGRLVRFLVDGTARFQGVIEDTEVKVVADDEEAGEVTTVTGRGTLALLDKVRVRPDQGLENLPYHETRWFNVGADRLRDNDAAAPQGVWPFGVNTPPDYDAATPVFGRPEGMVNTNPQWIWDADVTAGAAAGVVYFRQRDTFVAGDTYFEFAADDEGELWVDGVPLIKLEGVYKGGCRTARVILSAGEHLIAGFGRNLNALQAGVAASWWTVSDGMPNTLIGELDEAACRVLAYPADPPGFTPTEVVRLVVDEVQTLANPRLSGFTFSFLSASDTDSASVTEVTDITCKAPGDTLLTLVEMLGETYLDVGIEPDALELNAWIRGTRGSDLSATVVFEKGNCTRVTHDIVGADRATVALVSGSTFAPFEIVHADAATLGYEEVALDFGDASESSATRFATDYLNLVSDARRGVSLELKPERGPEPYVDFGIGDTISVPSSTGAAEDHRVSGIGCKVGNDSITRWNVELDQPRVEVDERLVSLMRRQLPGAAGGRTLLPSPTVPQFVPNETGSEHTETWSTTETGAVVLRKNGTAITGATLTVTAGNTDKVTLTDAARKYTKGADKIDFTVGGVAGFPAGWVPQTGRWLQELAVTAESTGLTITVRYV